MSTLATLIVEADTRQVSQASRDLAGLVTSSQNVERALTVQNGAFNAHAQTLRNLNPVLAQVNSAMNSLGQSNSSMAQHSSVASARIVAGMSSAASASQIAARTMQTSGNSMTAAMSGAASATQIASQTINNALGGMASHSRASMASMTESMAASLNMLNAQAAQTNLLLANLGSGNAGSGLRNVEQGAMGATQAMMLLGATVGGFSLKQISTALLDNFRMFEDLAIRATGVFGSIEAGAHAVQAAMQLDVKSPFDLKELTTSMVVLKNMGIEPTRQVMADITDTAAKLGQGNEGLAATVMQLGQAFSLGKLQMADLRILAARGVPVFEALERATGKTSAEIMKMSEAGTMGKDAIGALISELGKMAEGSSDRAMDSLTGKISSMSSGWSKFELAVMGSKTGTFIKILVDDWTLAIDAVTNKINGKVDVKDLNADIEALQTKLNDIKANGRGFLDFMTGRNNISRLQSDLDALLKNKADVMAQTEAEGKKSAQLDAEADARYAKSIAKTEEVATMNKSLVSARKDAVDAEISAVEKGASDELLIIKDKMNEIERLYKAGSVTIGEFFTRNAELIKAQFASSKGSVAEQMALIDKEIAALSSTVVPVEVAVNVKAGGVPFEEYFQQAAAKHGVDVNLLKAVAKQESNFNPNARSPVGALGVGQFMPATAARFGITDRTDPQQSIDGMAQYFVALHKMFDGNTKLMIAAYNAGEGAVKKYGNNIPPYKETQEYVVKVQKNMGELPKAAPGAETEGVQSRINDLERQKIELRSKSNQLLFEEKNALGANKDKLSEMGRTLEKNAQTASDTFDINLRALNEKREALAAIGEPLSERAYAKAIMDETEALYDSINATQSEKAALESQKEIQKLVSETRVKAVSEIDKLIEQQTRLNAAMAVANPAQQPLLQTALDGNALSMDAAADKDMQAWQDDLDKITSKTKDFGDVSNTVLDASLGGVNKLVNAFGKLGESLQLNAKHQAEFAEKVKDTAKNTYPSASGQQYAAQLIKNKNLIKDQDKLNRDSINDTLTGTRQVIGATAEMFEKKSTAYKALHTLEQGIAAAQMAMQAAQLAQTIAGIAPKVAGGVAALVEQGGWVGFAGAAAFLALMAGLGFSGGGGGGASISQQRQESAGTGTVLGDKNAKSDSINKSIAILEENSSISLPVYHKMLDALIAIKDSFAQLSNQIVREFNIKDPGSLSAGMIGGSMLGNGLGMALSPFGSKTKLVDYGYSFAPNQSLGDIKAGKELSVQFYNDLKKSTTFLSFSISSSMKRVSEEASDPIKKQFTNIFLGAVETLEAVGESFDIDKSVLEQKINDFKITIPDISLKDLKGEEITDMINAIFSSALDSLSSVVLGGISIEQYQNAGEGLLETAVRVSTGLMSLRENFERLGIAGTLAGQGVNDVIAFSQSLIHFSGGLDKLSDRFSNFFDRFYSESEKTAYGLNSLTKNVQALGLTFPSTRQGWRDMVNAELSLGEGRSKQAAKLLGLTDAADNYYTSVESAAEDAASSAQSAADSMEEAAKTLADLNKSVLDQIAQLTGRTVIKGLEDINTAIADLLGKGANGENVEKLRELKTAALVKSITDPIDKAAGALEQGSLGSIIDQKTKDIINLEDLFAKGLISSAEFARYTSQVYTTSEAAKQAALKSSVGGIATDYNVAMTPTFNAKQTALDDYANAALLKINDLALMWGVSTEKAKEKLQELLDFRQAAYEKEKVLLLKSVQDTFNRAQTKSTTGNDFESPLWSIRDSFVKQITDAAATGIKDYNQLLGIAAIGAKTAGLAFKEAQAQITTSFNAIYDNIASRRLNLNEAINKIEGVGKPGDLQKAQALADLDALNKKAVVQTLTTDEYNKQIGALDTLISLNQTRYDQELQNIEKINGIIDELMLNDSLSPLAASEKAKLTKTNYDIEITKAKAGDQKSMDNIGGTANDYLSNKLATSRNAEEYNTAFYKVMGDLNKLKNSSLTKDEQVKDAQIQQVAELKSLRDQLDAIEAQRRLAETSANQALIDAFNKVGKDFVDALQAFADAAGLKKDVQFDLSMLIISESSLASVTAFKNSIMTALQSGTLTDADAKILQDVSVGLVNRLAGLITRQQIEPASVDVILTASKSVVTNMGRLMDAQMIDGSDAVAVYQSSLALFDNLVHMIDINLIPANIAADIYKAQTDLIGALSQLMLDNQVTGKDAGGIVKAQDTLIRSITGAYEKGTVTAGQAGELYRGQKGLVDAAVAAIKAGTVTGKDVTTITTALTGFSDAVAKQLGSIKLNPSDTALYTNSLTVMSDTVASAIRSQNFSPLQIQTLTGAFTKLAENPSAVLKGLNFSQANLDLMATALTSAAGNPAAVFRTLGFSEADITTLTTGANAYAGNAGRTVAAVTPGAAAIGVINGGVDTLAGNIKSGLSDIKFLAPAGAVVTDGVMTFAQNIAQGLKNLNIAGAITAATGGSVSAGSRITNDLQAGVIAQFDALIAANDLTTAARVAIGAGYSKNAIAQRLLETKNWPIENTLEWLRINGFANGGDHVGGWRIVGEKGPELEATGAARYFDFDQSKAILNGGHTNGNSDGILLDIKAELRQLREDAVSFHFKEDQRSNKRTKYLLDLSDYAKKDDVEGTPPVRSATGIR